MKREIGEIFKFQGKYYKAIKESKNGCSGCAFKNFRDCTCDTYRDIIGWCSATRRYETTGVIFVEVDKPVGLISSEYSHKKKLLLII